MSAPPEELLIVRDDTGVRIVKFDPAQPALTDVATIVEGADVSNCHLALHPAGDLVAFADLNKVYLHSIKSKGFLFQWEEPKVTELAFSPSGALLVLYALPDAKRTDGNLVVVDVASGTVLLRCVQTAWPAMIWTSDESYCVRPAAGLLHVHQGDLKNPEPVEKLELQLPRGKEFALAPSPGRTPIVALFKPHHKQTQATVRICRLPSLKDEMFSVSYGRAEDATLQWSPSGQMLAVVSKMETDATNQSYYGTTALSLISAKDRAPVPVPSLANEIIHDVRWSPKCDELLVVHGPMPHNKATLFNSKAQPIFTFGEAPRNSCLWSPDAKMFALGGSGNLAGEFHFFNREGLGVASTSKTAATVAGGKLGCFSEKSSLQVWSPDSRFILCSTVFSRLRLDNKLVMWKHTGARVAEKKFKILHEALWLPVEEKQFVARPPSPVVTAEKPKSAAYRPPVQSAAAAALLARGRDTPVAAKPAGPVGAQLAEPKKKKR